MTYVGISRGRGWGAAKQDKETLRRPGAAVGNTKITDYNGLINVIESTDLDSGTLPDLEDFNNFLFSKSHEEYNKYMLKLYDQCIEDRIFGIKFSANYNEMVLSQTKKKQERNYSLLYIILRKLQSDYENKDEIYKSDLKKFQNTVSLFGNLYYVLRSMKVIEKPMLQYLTMLVKSATSDDIILVTTLVVLNRAKLNQEHEEFDDLILATRKVLISHNLGASFRAMLLLIIELSGNNFQSLPEKAKQFYLSEIKQTDMVHMERLCDLIKQIPTKCGQNTGEKIAQQKPKMNMKRR